jgi:hypothetical protein
MGEAGTSSAPGTGTRRLFMRASQNLVIALGRAGRSNRSPIKLQGRSIMRNLVGASLCLFVSLMIACSSSDPSAEDPSPADPAGDNADTAGDISSQMVGKWATASYYQQQPIIDGYPGGLSLSPYPDARVVAADGSHLVTLGGGWEGEQYACAPWDPNFSGSGYCDCNQLKGKGDCLASCYQVGTWSISGVKQTSGYYQGTLTLAIEESEDCSGALTLTKGKYSWLFDFDPHPSYDDRPTLKLYKVNDSVHGGDGHEWDYELSPAM